MLLAVAAKKKSGGYARSAIMNGKKKLVLELMVLFALTVLENRKFPKNSLDTPRAL